MPDSPPQDIPPFEITSARSNGFCVVRIIGELDMAHEDELHETLELAVKDENDGIVVDLSECEFIDSSGVRSLLMGREAQESATGVRDGLAVATGSEQVLRILTVMGVDKVIPVRPTVEEAMSALQG